GGAGAHRRHPRRPGEGLRGCRSGPGSAGGRSAGRRLRSGKDTVYPVTTGQAEPDERYVRPTRPARRRRTRPTEPVPASGAWREDHPIGNRQFVDLGPLQLEAGGQLPQVTMSYESWRSEERRVGKECRYGCGEQKHEKKESNKSKNNTVYRDKR